MDISLRPQVEQYINQAISEGRYASVEDFLMEAAEALIAEEQEDIQVSQEVLAGATPGSAIPWAEVKAELGL
ncbi:hypothetical protein C1752_01814 [Acaryochloris thomasi RCC1774]|uniref:Uncharacterized protein n=1 Tax=Acaryochloris thomasi RCC1774 TaxID=1764569 RepID=A0A2W1JWJ0_9CYAN|nr:hypothetical protein [Acaryochloris thomasi]PZD74044.1 hypothetical protein C1752_01814 [Acaryochloris thomasi RCC1774]